MPPCVIEGNLKALEISVEENFRKETLKENAEYLRNRLTEEDFDTGESQTQIIPVIMKNNEEALEYHKRLLEKGIYLPAIRKPTVTKPRLRISLGYLLGKEDIDYLVEALVEIKSELDNLGK